MKLAISLLVAVCLCLAMPGPVSATDNFNIGFNQCTFGDFEIEIIRNTVYISQPDYNNDEISIDGEYQLFVNDKPVKLTMEQGILVKDLHDGIMHVHREIKHIGWEGAKLGIEGAKIGLYAIGAVGKMLLTSYTEDEMEADIEARAEEIEAKAEVIEEKAEALEDIADELEEIFEELIIDVPELAKLDW